MPSRQGATCSMVDTLCLLVFLAWECFDMAAMSIFGVYEVPPHSASSSFVASWLGGKVNVHTEYEFVESIPFAPMESERDAAFDNEHKLIYPFFF